MKLRIGKKSGLKYFNMADIRSFKPCYDPNRHLAEDWRGTAVDILKHDKIPYEDKLWVVLRPEIVSERVMRLFAVWCARQVQHLMTDARSIAALDVAERFANGEATQEELAAARAAAWDAAWDAQKNKLIEMIEAEGLLRKQKPAPKTKSPEASVSP